MAVRMVINMIQGSQYVYKVLVDVIILPVPLDATHLVAKGSAVNAQEDIKVLEMVIVWPL